MKDMLRPMLKAWLDDNLPPLVERLVRAEIERVARRRGRLESDLSDRTLPIAACARRTQDRSSANRKIRTL